MEASLKSPTFLVAALAALACGPLQAASVTLPESEIWELFHQYQEVSIERFKARYRYKAARGRTSTHPLFKDELTRHKYDRTTRIARDDNIPGVTWSEERFTAIPEQRCTESEQGLIHCILIYDREYRFSRKPADITTGTHRLELHARRHDGDLRLVSFRDPHGTGWCPAIWESEEDCQ